MSKTILETERLLLREFTPDDALDVFNLNDDYEVIRYTGDVGFKSVEAARTFLINYNHYQLYGFGRWACILKSDKQVLGWCGLKFMPEKGEYDLGYRFSKKYWGHGYATEAARASLHYGFTTLGLLEIVGRAAKANLASIRVLEKLGMKYHQDILCGDQDGVCLKLDKPTYLSQKGEPNE